MNGWRFLAAMALVAIVVGAPGSAVATGVTLPELSALASAAADGDDAARAQLAAVTEVDGRPVDTARLLDGRAADVEQRLRTLAELAPGTAAVDAERARSEAASILAGAEYQRGEPTPPGWLQSFTEWLAGLVPDEIGEILSNRTFWIVLALVAITTVLYFIVRNASRRRREDPTLETDTLGLTRRTARALEDRARRAADTGDYSTAVRLWFEAGALRLADRGVVAHDITSTSGTIRRAVPTKTVANLASTFDRVAYGAHPASANDAHEAEQGWTTVVAELGRHG